MQHTIEMMTPTEYDRSRDDAVEDSCFGALSTARGHLPLAAMDVSAKIVGLCAHTKLRQTFVNTLGTAIEATYMFPLPSRAAVTGFRMELAGRVVEGVISERGQAREEYERAIRDGHRAAITEEERPGVFTMRVGNLMPGERADVHLTLVGPVAIEDGDATFRFPLVVAPRFIPGVPLPGEDAGDGVARDTDLVPDASRISPPILLAGYPNPVQLRLRLDIDPAGMALSGLRSSLHAVIEEQSEGWTRIELRPGERLDRDFIARFSLADDAVQTSLVVAPEIGDEASGRGEADADGAFSLALVPPVASGSARPRDVAIVLDRSGSMAGWKMVCARRAAARMIDSLTDADRFSVLAFDNTIDTPPGLDPHRLAPATDRNRFRAVEFLATLEARGGTQMAQPLERAAHGLAGGYEDRERVLVLVTDGQVGNEDHILRALAGSLENVRVFTLGIDRAVNEGFLQRLAALGAGACALVESEDRLDDVMDGIRRRIGTPVITELSVTPEDLAIEPGSLVPSRLPDLFEGSPIVISGRYRGAGSGRVRVSGRDRAGAPWSVSVLARRAESDEERQAVSKTWARGAVRALEDAYAIGRGNQSGLERRIVEVSLRHSVLCRFTAFLAVDRAERVNPGGSPHRIVQPVSMPDGWAATQSSAMPAFMAPRAPGRARPQVMSAAGGPPPSPARRRAVAPGAPPPPAMSRPEFSAPRPAPAIPRAMSPAAPVAPEPAAPNLQPYWDRLASLRDRLASDLERGVSDVRTRAQLLHDGLSALLADLSSAGGLAATSSRAAAQVRGVCDALRAALTSGADAQLREALAGAVRSLTDAVAAARPDAVASRDTRRPFWK